MKRNQLWMSVACAVMLAVAMNLQAAVQTTAFTYQGQLTGGTLPPGQPYQFTFTLYDAATNGSVVGTPIQQAIAVAAGGLFTTDLDFGQSFNGQQLWLEIKVGTTIGTEQILSARQQISAVPVAQYALNSPVRLMFLSSASQATVTTDPSGASQTVAVLPLSGSVSSAYETTNVGGNINLTPNGSTPQPPQIVPVNGQFGSISAQIFLTTNMSFIEPVTIQAQLYTGNLSSGLMFPSPLTCFLAPSLSGFVPAGTTASCMVNGAAIPVSAGSTAVVVVSATAYGSPISNSIPMNISVSVGP
ncbi:MAG: hypothetical protein ABIO74_11025 [Dokdonella sp.]